MCESDVSGATALSSPAASSDLYGTQTIGSYGKIRSLKAVSFENLYLYHKISYLYCLLYILFYFEQVAVLQMLEKQMGPDSFRKVFTYLI